MAGAAVRVGRAIDDGVGNTRGDRLARSHYRRVGESAGGLLDVPIYVGVSVEAGNVWQSRSDINLSSAHVNGSIFAGFDTLIGPVYLAAGFGEGGRANYYLFFGSPPR